MTTDEIRALIAKKISGQGTMVDVGGGLPAILNALLDKVEAAEAAAPKVLHCGVSYSSELSIQNVRVPEIAEQLNISEQEALNLVAGVYNEIEFTNNTLIAGWRGDGSSLYGGLAADQDNGMTFQIFSAGEEEYDIEAIEL